MSFSSVRTSRGLNVLENLLPDLFLLFVRYSYPLSAVVKRIYSNPWFVFCSFIGEQQNHGQNREKNQE
jgi:hypothetical protein